MSECKNTALPERKIQTKKRSFAVCEAPLSALILRYVSRFRGKTLIFYKIRSQPRRKRRCSPKG